jgi:hypothetical protein
MTRTSPLIGVGFVPDILDRALLDEVMVVTDDDAMTAARRLVRGEGILAGVSSGAVVHAALMTASRRDEIGKMIVVVRPDSAERCGTTVTIVECRLPWRGDLGPEWSRFPIAQLHYDPARTEWGALLARPQPPLALIRSDLPCVPRRRLLAEIDADPTAVFWA